MNGDGPRQPHVLAQPAPPGVTATVEMARRVLRTNDNGRWTIPTDGLYPHQWNWDSALIALGIASFDPQRAWDELVALTELQRPDGMIPHIGFDPASHGYEPGPDWWDAGRGNDGRLVSGITQPPVAATCVRLLYERYPRTPSIASSVVSRLQRWHDWFFECRVNGADPHAEHAASRLPVVIHPWESGRDNAPDWDPALSHVTPTDSLFTRVDTSHVDADDRPTDGDYRRYVSLVEFARKTRWNQHTLATASPFRVIDPGFSALLAASCNDLAHVARELGLDDIADRAVRQSAMLSEDMALLFPRVDTLRAIDLRDGSRSPTLTCSAPLVLCCPLLQSNLVDELEYLVIDGELSSSFGVRSAAPAGPGYQPRRYWRGPVWANVTWLVAHGLRMHGRAESASILLDRLRHVVEMSGCREYFDPETGAGLGASNFSWTASLYLHEFSAC